MIEVTPLSGVDEDVCVMLRFANHPWSYLCDCGMASALTIKECRRVAALFLSHAHIDHIIGFDQMIRHQLDVGRPIVICGPPGTASHISAKLRGYLWNLLWDEHAVTFEIREVIEPGVWRTCTLRVPEWLPEWHDEDIQQSATIFANDAFAVTFSILDHNTPSIAYRFDETPTVRVRLAEGMRPGPWVREAREAFARSDGARVIDVHGTPTPAADLFSCFVEEPGPSVGFVMDHAGTAENHRIIAAHMRRVDQLVIECYYRHDDLALAQANAHSTAVLSGQAARLAEAREVVPLHFSRRYNAEVEDVRQECLSAFAGEHGESPARL